MSRNTSLSSQNYNSIGTRLDKVGVELQHHQTGRCYGLEVVERLKVNKFVSPRDFGMTHAFDRSRLIP
jgi:hypothetical protein